jgi:plastocyanin
MGDVSVVTTFIRDRGEIQNEGYTMGDQTDDTRRTFLKLAGAATLTSLAGCLRMNGGGGGGGDGNESGGGGKSPKKTFKLGGKVAGWQARAPGSIEGKTNPTLQMTAGTTYEIVWENLDGKEHELIIESGSGEEIAATEHAKKKGQTRSVTFEATTEMASYYCEYHPKSMRGKVGVNG